MSDQTPDPARVAMDEQFRAALPRVAGPTGLRLDAPPAPKGPLPPQPSNTGADSYQRPPVAYPRKIDAQAKTVTDCDGNTFSVVLV